jgi:hypothetical protein
MASYQEYKSEFIERIRADSAINGSDTEDEFMSSTIAMLEDYNEYQDVQRVNMGDKRGSNNRVMRFDAYTFNESDKSLVLFISDFVDTLTPENLTQSRVDELYWRLFYFLDETCNGNINNYFDDSDDIVKVARLIKRRVNAINDDAQQILSIKFVVLTNKDLSLDLLKANKTETTVKRGGKKKVVKSTKKIKKEEFASKPLEICLWHLERFYEREQSNLNESILLDFERDYNSKGIPCIKGDLGDNLGYEAYIAIMPGKLLADIYIDQGSKVLEGNVRAYLGTGTSKSVNYGIRKTLNTEPTKFFTYNNGIACTAVDVETELIDGVLYITKIVDFQIINGGQTTATLAEAVLKKLNTELAGVYVPMKLTVIEDREMENEDGVRFYDEMVTNIARYANFQNKVTASDLFSNDPFHIAMEKMSKKYLAPPALYPIPTGWYYERSRKKYQQEQFKLSGELLKRFLAKFPKAQIITKEQLAMYLTAVSERPYAVAKGKDWVIKEFNGIIKEEYKKSKDIVNDFYFKKCICSAILYRTVDNYLEKNKDSARKPTGFWYKTGGYKYDIVPYTVAKIMSLVPDGMSIDWNYIWQNQAVSPAIMREIEIITKMTNDFIMDSHGVIVTEYCKHKETWEAYRDTVKYTADQAFYDDLVSESLIKQEEDYAKKDQKDLSDIQLVVSVVEQGADYWKRMLEYGERSGNISNTDKHWLTQAIDFATSGKIPYSASGKIPLKTMTIIRSILEVKEKIESLGVKF